MNELNFFVQNGWIQDGRIQDGCHHQINQIELVWVRVLCTIAESKMADFKMAAIIKLIRLNSFQSESEWSESVFEWIWEKITRCLNPRWQCLNPRWQNSRWLPSSSWVRKWMSEVFLCIMAESKMVEFKMAAIINLSDNEWVKFFLVQNGWNQDGRIQDIWHHQVEWEWMSESDWIMMSQSLSLNPRWQNHHINQMVWIRVRVELFLSESEITRSLNPRCAKWLNPRWQNSRWLPSSSWVRMNEWSFFCAKWLNPRGRIQDGWHLKLSENEWVLKIELFESEFCAKWLNPRWQTFQDGCHHQVESEWMSLSQSQSGVECFWVNLREDNNGVWIQDGSGWIQSGRIQDGCHHQVESEWMSEVFLCKMAESKMAEFKMAAIIKLSGKMVESKMAEFKMAAIIRLIRLN